MKTFKAAVPLLMTMSVTAVLELLISPSFSTTSQSVISKVQQAQKHSSVVRSLDDDADNDGLRDSLEQELAEKYAPIVYHYKNERNFPSNVGDFLQRPSLFFFDKDCSPNTPSDPQHTCSKPPSDLSGMSCLVQKKLDMQALQIHRCQLYDHCKQKTYYADTWLDRNKELTFYLSDVEGSDRKGDPDTTTWITYYHAYVNDKCLNDNGIERCGVTIQYWRFYAYNTGPLPGGLGSHGGDWEAVHVVLDEKYQPVEARLLGHRSISYYRRAHDQLWVPDQRWGALRWEGDHPKIKSENGGHASSPFNKDDETPYIRQETWKGGKVRWPPKQPFHLGQFRENNPVPLRNLGEKIRPMEGMYFIQYSGLWGSPGKSLPIIGPISSGYWGPGYNETSERRDGFITAWCEGMKDPNKKAETNRGGTIRECYRPNNP